MHEIGIETSLFEVVRMGDKTIEGRLGKPRFLKIQTGDALTIREDIWSDGQKIGSHDDTLLATVKQVLYFESFEEMLAAVDFTAAIPTANSSGEAVAKYREFYTAKDEEEYGVVAFFFEVDSQEASIASP